jgi:hypothetical protein
MNLDNLLNNIENANAKATENLNGIREKLFEVQDITIDAPFENYENPKTQVIYTSDGRYLGTCGDKYKSIQPSTFLDQVVQSVEGCGSEKFDLSKLTYKEVKNGCEIIFRLPLGNSTWVNRNGKSEDRQNFIDFRTGFGGTARTQISTYEYRLICSNGMMGWAEQSMLQAKHTERMNAKALLFCDAIVQLAESIENTTELYKHLDKISVTDKEIDAFARKLSKINLTEDMDKVSTRKTNIYNSLRESIAIEFARSGTSAYGLLQGATHFTNHVASGHGEEYILARSGAKTNALAQSLVTAMV